MNVRINEPLGLAKLHFVSIAIRNKTAKVKGFGKTCILAKNTYPSIKLFSISRNTFIEFQNLKEIGFEVGMYMCK